MCYIPTNDVSVLLVIESEALQGRVGYQQWRDGRIRRVQMSPQRIGTLSTGLFERATPWTFVDTMMSPEEAKADIASLLAQGYKAAPSRTHFAEPDFLPGSFGLAPEEREWFATRPAV